MFGRLIDFLGPLGPSSLGIPIDSLVSDCFSSTGWTIPHARTERNLQVLAYITTISFDAGYDLPIWNIDGTAYSSFSSKRVWNHIRRVKPLVPWRDVLWFKAYIPKHSTTVWLFILDRNPTLLRMNSWGLDVDTTCLLCGNAQESRDHLFFDCEYSMDVWKAVCLKLHLQIIPTNWDTMDTFCVCRIISILVGFKTGLAGLYLYAVEGEKP